MGIRITRTNFAVVAVLVLGCCLDGHRTSAGKIDSDKRPFKQQQPGDVVVDAKDIIADGDDGPAPVHVGAVGGSSESYEYDESNEDGTPRQAYAVFSEKFITPEAAQRLRQRLHERGETHISPQDYDYLMQEVQSIPARPAAAHSIYEKKYFDYLPAEPTSEDGDSVKVVDLPPIEIEFEQLYAPDDEPKLVQPVPQLDDLDVEAVNHRAKRDVVLNSEFVSNQWRQSVWNQRQSSNFQDQLYIAQLLAEQNRQAINPNNPWNNRFYGPNNFYLPVAPPINHGYFYPRPSVPFAINTGNPHNAGTPPHNPRPVVPLDRPSARPTQGPTNVDTDDTSIGTRIGEDNTQGPDMFDDRPVWGAVPSAPLPASRNDITTNLIPGTVPTRQPPPLIHNSDDDYVPPRRTPVASTSTRGNTNREQPGLMHDSDADANVPPRRPAPAASASAPAASGRGSVTLPVWSTGRIPQFDNSVFPSQVLPAPQAPPQQSSFRPQQPPPQQQAPSQPSSCVWGIVNCCSRNNLSVRYACFEAIGCQGSFWDVNPCNNNVFDAAIEEANRFFN